jgi:putative tricarboxylic transport membrane protein
MLTKHLPLTFELVWTIVLANLAIVLTCYIFLDKIASLTLIRPNLLIPFILLLVFIGGYTSSNSMADLVVTLISGVVGYIMVRCGLPRPPFILGFVLGKLAETYFYSAYLRYDIGFLARPKVLLILALAIVAAVWPLIQQRRMAARGGPA